MFLSPDFFNSNNSHNVIKTLASIYFVYYYQLISYLFSVGIPNITNQMIILVDLLLINFKFISIKQFNIFRTSWCNSYLAHTVDTALVVVRIYVLCVCAPIPLVDVALR